MQTYPLSENRTETIRTEDGGENTFYIEKNRVTMKEANCHDKICVNTRSISKNGETIVCLPHKLVLAIITEDSAPYVPDAVVGGIP